MNTGSRIYTSALMVLTLTPCLALAQTAVPNEDNPLNHAWHADSVVLVAGLGSLKQNTIGSLAMTGDNLVFSVHGAHEQIPLREITSVSIGDERVATGGNSAKVARKVFIFGFGAAAGALTSKTVDVLTIEFQNAHSGYHGAVFEVPKGQAEIAQQHLIAFQLHPTRKIARLTATAPVHQGRCWSPLSMRTDCTCLLSIGCSCMSS